MKRIVNVLFLSSLLSCKLLGMQALTGQLEELALTSTLQIMLFCLMERMEAYTSQFTELMMA